MEPMLKVTDLAVSYGHVEALRGINVEVHKGQIVSIIGANGAGKTTMLRTISGLVKPKTGTVEFEGEPLPRKALGICDYAYVLENGKINLSGSGEELLQSDAVRKAYLGG